MKILLFGPPGIGKSTLIGKIKSAGVAAIDLEDVTSKVRYQIPNQTQADPIVLGAADLDPKRKYPGWRKVLLVTSEDDYKARRATRDRDNPEKASQAEHSLDQWMRGVNWDFTVDTQGRSADTTASEIIKLIR